MTSTPDLGILRSLLHGAEVEMRIQDPKVEVRFGLNWKYLARAARCLAAVGAGR